MQMRGNLHRYRVSPSGKRNRMLQGTYMLSYRPVLKFAAYGLLYSLLLPSPTVVVYCSFGWPKKNGTVDFLGRCPDQQLSFFTLLDRTSSPHYNDTKIIKFG